MAHFFMSMSGSKIREQVAHFLVDIHKNYFTNEKGEKMEIDKIFSLLHFIANNE